jgi:hypothetical protein
MKVAASWLMAGKREGTTGAAIRGYALVAIGGTRHPCDPFGTPSTSPWTDAAIIAQ